MSLLLFRGLTKYLVTHPAHAVVLLRAGWRLRRRGWWRHWPPVPVPPLDYWRFRLSTVGGSPEMVLTPEALIEAARWSMRQRVGQ